MKEEILLQYKNLEYLVFLYAKKIKEYNLHYISQDKDDVIQRFRIVLYRAIKKFYFKADSKKISLQAYVEQALTNERATIIKEIVIATEKIKGSKIKESFVIELNEYNTDIDWKNNRVIVNGNDLMIGLNEQQRTTFSSYLQKGVVGAKIRSKTSKNLIVDQLNKIKLAVI